MDFELNLYQFSERACSINGFVLKEEVTLEQKAYSAGLAQDQLEYLASPMPEYERSPSPNTNESKTSPRQWKNALSPDLSPSPDLSTTALVVKAFLQLHYNEISNF